LKVNTRANSPQDWASTQNDLATALKDKAQRSEGAETMLLLREAVAAYREALKVYSLEDFPQNYAAIQTTWVMR